MYESVTTDRRVCNKFKLLYGTLSLIHGIQSRHVALSHSRILTMPPNRRCSLQKKAEEDATRGRPHASMSQDFRVGDIGSSGNAGSQLYESGLYQQYHYSYDN